MAISQHCSDVNRQLSFRAIARKGFHPRDYGQHIIKYENPPPLCLHFTFIMIDITVKTHYI